MLVMFAGVYISGNHGWLYGAVFCLALLVVFYPVAGYVLRLRLKENLVDYLCAVTGFRFSSCGYFQFSDILSFHMPQNIVTKAYASKSEDAFYGDCAGLECVFQEMVFAGEDYAKRAANNHARNIFPDRWIFVLLKTKKQFDGLTIIVPDSAVTRILHEKFSFMEKTGLVSAEFEETYDVFSTDQVAARYLMDPLMIEKFIEFGKINNTGNIEIGFQGRHVLLAYRSPFPLIWVPHFAALLFDRDAFAAILSNLHRFRKEVAQLEDIIQMLDLTAPTAA